jgi:hypothetical protein
LPRNPSGVYSLPAGTLPNTGDVIQTSQHNPAMQDIEASMTNSLSRSGLGGMLADLSLGGFKAKDLAAATLAGDAPRYDQTNGATISTGLGVTTGNAIIEVGGLRTGSGVAAVDFHSVSGTDFEARLLRYSGANGQFDVRNTGTGAMNFVQEGLAPFTFYTNGVLRAQISAGGTLSLLTSNLDLVSNGIVWSTVPNAAVGLSSGNLVFQGDAGDFYEIDRVGNFHRWLIGSTEMARLTATGRLGIGTTAPMTKLQIVGGGTVDGQAGTAAILGAGGGADLFLGSTGGAPFVASQGTASLNFAVNGSNRVSVDNSGNLNILAVANYSIGTSGGNPRSTYATNEHITYDLANKKWVWSVGGSTNFTVDGNYGVFYGASGAPGTTSGEVGFRDRYVLNIVMARTIQYNDRQSTYVLGGGPYNITIPTDASIPHRPGATIDIINPSVSVMGIVPDVGVTLVWSPSGTTGTRSLNPNGWALLRKTSANQWFVMGEGIS